MNIEELAFKDRNTLANLNAIDLLDIIEFLKYDRRQWINQFAKTHNESVDIQKENKEMKEDIQFCLHSIKQELEMSKDERTRSEITSCYEILKRWNK